MITVWCLDRALEDFTPLSSEPSVTPVADAASPPAISSIGIEVGHAHCRGTATLLLRQRGARLDPPPMNQRRGRKHTFGAPLMPI